MKAMKGSEAIFFATMQSIGRERNVKERSGDVTLKMQRIEEFGPA